MKKLKMFAPFNANLFFSKVQLQFLKTEPIKENETIVGIKYKLLISDDTHDYNGETALNIGEMITVKVMNANGDTNFKMNQLVTLVNPTATIYGDYQNQLSVKADKVLAVK